MVAWHAVWSYVHDDDDADNERISRLARDVSSQYEMLTGEKLNVFLDKDAIKWGEEWRDRIDKGLITVPLFIPVLTPRYFQSSECRRELQFFAHNATELGEKELVLPLLYVDVPSLHNEAPSDTLVALIKTFQWEDWRDLRFTEVDSEKYRRGVDKLATRLVEANAKVDQIDMVTAATTLEGFPEEEDDEAPGLLDRLATAEEALPQWITTVESIGEDIELIGKIMEEGTADIARADSKGKGFAARLAIARKLSQELNEPAERIWSYSNEFASQLHDVDLGMRAMIAHAPDAILNSPDERPEICGFFQSIRELSHSVGNALKPIQGMINNIQDIEPMSRDLRAPLRRLRQGLTIIMEARDVTAEWTRLIDEAGVDCNDIPTRES